MNYSSTFTSMKLKIIRMAISPKGLLIGVTLSSSLSVLQKAGAMPYLCFYP